MDIHSLLDIAGLAPVIGSAADIANLIVYLFEGDTLNAVIAAIAALPAADILKGLKTLGNVADAAGTAGKKAIKEGLERVAKTLVGNSGSVKIAKESLENTAELLGKEIAETAGEKAAKETAENVSGIVLEGAGKLNIDDAQFGKKIGKHAQDYGLNPADPNARSVLRETINDVFGNPTEIRQGEWMGLGEKLPSGVNAPGQAKFYIQGNDVMITDLNGNFVSIMKDGINNLRVQGATKIWP